MQVEGPVYGMLPSKPDTWWDFRVTIKRIDTLLVHLIDVSLSLALPMFYGRKEELTDSRGVFDALKAERIIRGQNL